MHRWAAVGVILIALAIRLHGVGFGLPALLDPDEPFFVSTAVHMLSDGTLNPHWFGHPGTLTFYAILVVAAGEFLIGLALGWWADAKAFGDAFYADPTLVMLPLRLFFVMCGVGCVTLTMAIGRRLGDWRAALLAGAIIALSPLHVSLSQIVRTDVMAGLFMLLTLHWSLSILERDRLADMALAAVGIGLATMSKWPGAAVVIVPVLAVAMRARATGQSWRWAVARWGSLIGFTAIAIVVISPYLLLEWRTLVVNLTGETRAEHLGANGHGFVGNLGWYAASVLPVALGPLVPILALVGTVAVAARRAAPGWLLVLAPPALFLVLIAVHPLVWERWVTPILPFLALLAALGILQLSDWIGTRRGAWRSAAMAVLAAGALLPAAAMALAGARERTNDTRVAATTWALNHLQPGTSVAIEWFGFQLLAHDGRILFPVGDRGCVDVRAEMKRQTDNRQVAPQRSGRSLITLGSVAAAGQRSCDSDYALVSHYDRYLAEAGSYPREIAAYRALARGGEEVAVFRPVPGVSGGPVVRILRRARVAPPVTR